VTETPGTIHDHKAATMPAENAKNKEKKSTESDEKSRVQEQVLDAIKRSQEATLQIVSAWGESVSKIADKLPEMPKMPTIESLPKASEITDQFFDFAQKLMVSQQEFVKKLIDALPSHHEEEG
jgi:Ni,Fe-hydrogenase I large subunit